MVQDERRAGDSTNRAAGSMEEHALEEGDQEVNKHEKVEAFIIYIDEGK